MNENFTSDKEESTTPEKRISERKKIESSEKEIHKIALQEKIIARKEEILKRDDIDAEITEEENPTDTNDEITDADGPIQANIVAQRILGKRITLKDRIERRKQETREKYPDGHPPPKKYYNLKKIPLIQNYLLDNAVNVNDYRNEYFRRILKKRLIRLYMDDYEEYYNFLFNNSQEINKFRDSLSINVTRFFRNREVWQFIQDDLFKHLINHVRENPDKNEIKIWSAGCAIGAEPYSLAMIWSKLKKNIPRISLQITATDIKEELLSTARKGIYGKEHISELTETEITENFRLDDRKYLLTSKIKSHIKFFKLDLVNDPSPDIFDLIICRNVLIYIGNEAKKDIFQKFFKSLRSDGFLVIGKSESVVGEWREHVENYSMDHRIYQKL